MGSEDGCCQPLGCSSLTSQRRAARAPASEEEVVCKTAALVVTKRGTLHICLFAISSVSGRILLVTLDCFPASCRFWKVSRSAAMWKALNFKWEQAQCSRGGVGGVVLAVLPPLLPSPVPPQKAILQRWSLGGGCKEMFYATGMCPESTGDTGIALYKICCFLPPQGGGTQVEKVPPVSAPL